MAKQQPLDVEWVLDVNASSDEIATVTQIALEEGLAGQVRAAYSQKSMGDIPWIVFIMAPVTLFLKGFFEEAGRHGYKDLRRLVLRLLAVRPGEQRHVVLMERDSLTTIVFPPDLPEEAFEQLLKLGLENIEGKYWVWDPEQNCWIFQSMNNE